MATERLISVLRGANGFRAIASVWDTPLDWSRPLEAAERLNGGSVVALKEVGKEEIRPEDMPSFGQLLQAWGRMGSAQITSASLADLVSILTETVLDTAKNAGALPLKAAETPPAFRATAAHPRAYEGTGARPPKSAAPARFDFRAIAIDPNATKAILFRFKPLLSAAADQISPLTREHADLILESISRPTFAGWDGMSLDPGFRRHLWWRLRWAPPRKVASVHNLFINHPLREDPALLAAAGWWLASGHEEHQLSWLSTALGLPGRMAEVTLAVCASQSSAVASAAIPTSEVASAAGDDLGMFAYELQTLIESQLRNVPARLMLPGLELSRGMPRRQWLGNSSPTGPTVPDDFASFAMARDERDWQPMAVSLWEALAGKPELTAVLFAQDWTDLSQDASTSLLDALRWCWSENPLEAQAQERWWRGELAHILDCLAPLEPDFQEKAAATIREITYLIEDGRRLEQLWPALLAATLRLCAAPFTPGTRSVGAWNNLFDHGPKHLWPEVMDAPTRPWRRLEKHCRVPATAELIERGFHELGRAHGALLVEAFLAAPDDLYALARTLGALSEASSRRVCRTPVQGSVTDRLTALLDESLKEVRGRLDVDPAEPGIRHALLLQRAITSNKRALRGFIRAHAGGDADYVRHHPLTGRWLATHPGLPADRWTSGIDVDGDLPALGQVRLSVESDPLEALQLGTYVGSCLSIGGLCDYSAAAVVLDINKQVVYARNRRGSVIARQLLAISEAVELLAFGVYPRSTPRSLERLFLVYDERFAEALGLKLRLAGKEDDDYEVKQVIAEKWWDDGLWETAPQRSRTSAG